MKSDFYKIIANSQEIPKNNLDFDPLFRQWQQNKQYYIDLFGGQLIYKTPEVVSFPLTETEKTSRVNNFLDWLDESFIWGKTKDADLYALYDFINRNTTSFFDNQIKEKYVTKIYLNGFDDSDTLITIPAGTKIIKAFKYFVKDKELLYLLQNKASMILQEDKIEGRLCLSVHPLDYLTISENNFNWHSCHSLTHDYRAGNLNYMADTSTVVCYLEAEQPTEIYGVKWNDKKWRMLLFFSKNHNIIFAGKHYPFSLPAAQKEIRDIILNLTNSNWTDWAKGMESVMYPNNHKTEFEWPQYNLGATVGLVGLNKIVKENKFHLYFNDLLKSSTYKNPYYMIKYDSHYALTNSDNDDWEVCIGEDVICPVCHNYILTQPHSMICHDCLDNYENKIKNSFGICAYCWSTLPEDNMIEVCDSGDKICPSCADKYTSICIKCGKRYPNDEMKANGTLCGWCLIDLEEENK